MLKFSLIAIASVFSSLALAQKGPIKAMGEIKNVSGEKVGMATLSETNGGVALNVDITNMAPGTYAIHIHNVASCTPPDFKSAGSHFNPDKKQHGLKNPKGPHSGDLPNLVVNATSKAVLDYSLAGANLSDGASPRSLLAGKGTALVIHAKADDEKTDPSGQAGDRIACAAFKKVN